MQVSTSLDKFVDPSRWKAVGGGIASGIWTMGEWHGSDRLLIQIVPVAIISALIAVRPPELTGYGTSGRRLSRTSRAEKSWRRSRESPRKPPPPAIRRACLTVAGARAS
jgi:hypothetical protein